jgi:hypothetical protein
VAQARTTSLGDHLAAVGSFTRPAHEGVFVRVLSSRGAAAAHSLAARLDTRIDAGFARVDTRFDAIESRLDGLASRLDAHADQHA